MRTRAAVIREAGKPWEVTELDLDEPAARRCGSGSPPPACATRTSTSVPATRLDDGELIRGVILHD